MVFNLEGGEGLINYGSTLKRVRGKGGEICSGTVCVASLTGE